MMATFEDGTTEVVANLFEGAGKLESVTIPDSVTTIGNYAFQNCKALTDVYYRGTQEEWQKIAISTYGNDYLLNATIHFEYIYPTVEIINFTVNESGYINLKVANAPSDAVVYVASYDSLGKLLELQNLILNNGNASAIFSTSSVSKYKAFIWEGDTLKSLSNSKEYIFDQN